MFFSFVLQLISWLFCKWTYASSLFSFCSYLVSDSIFSEKLDSILNLSSNNLVSIPFSHFNLSAGGSQDRTGRWTIGLVPCLAPGKPKLFVTKTNYSQIHFVVGTGTYLCDIELFYFLDFLCNFFVTASNAAPRIPPCRRMLASNLELLRLWHWQSDALTTRLDLIQPYLFTSSPSL